MKFILTKIKPTKNLETICFETKINDFKFLKGVERILLYSHMLLFWI